MSATVQRERSRVDSRDAELIASEAFARVFRAYIECSDAAQEAIRDMVEIVNDPETTTDERDAALLTIAEALFPSPGADLEECETHAHPMMYAQSWTRRTLRRRHLLTVLGAF